MEHNKKQSKAVTFQILFFTLTLSMKLKLRTNGIKIKRQV